MILLLKQTLHLENEKINSPPITSNLNELATDIGSFVKSSLSDLTIPDCHGYNKVQLLQLSNIPNGYFIYPESASIRNSIYYFIFHIRVFFNY